MNHTASQNPDLQNQSASKDTSTKREDLPPGSVIPWNEREFQAAMLAGVSRTFALTIPQLPLELRDVVSNAYLLCRIVDTIEDEPELTPDLKKQFCDFFLDILQTEKDPEELKNTLSLLLSSHTIPAEHKLIENLHRVVKITKSFAGEQQHALVRCVRIMSEGMVYFQHHASPLGLKHQQELDKYCYHVAGVVGEMLTELFCYYSPEIARNRQQLFELASSFGQGLQMTNILKDIWDDQKRGACWLPKDLFAEKGLRLNEIDTLVGNEQYHHALFELLGIAHAHLENALKYTMLIPPQEKGIREFCLWALGMAMLTLRKIHKYPGFTSGNQVKISRNSVKATVLISGLIVKKNASLRGMFRLLGRGLPKANLATISHA